MNTLIRRTRAAAALACALLALCACAANDVGAGLVNGRLAPCPKSPNCVSSDAVDEEHHVQPYRLKANAGQTWQGLQQIVLARKRTTLVSVDDSYLHIETRSAIFRFVDDTEFQLRADEGIIAVRSAARIGYSDFGVNRERVESIREALRSRQLIE
jgi:uncharacterized protein (DUF1499 family)